MIALDSNILIHAYHRGSPSHVVCEALLRQLAESDQPWCIPVYCLTEFVRVVTHPRTYNPPAPLEDALDWLEILLLCPSIQVLLPQEGFPKRLLDEFRQHHARGNLAFDAQIAALCREHEVKTLVTYDRDFARFPNVSCVTPETLIPS